MFRRRLSLPLPLLLLCFALAAAQVESPHPRKFVTTYEITLYKDASFRSGKAGKIPANVVLEAIQETERYAGYIQVLYKKKLGWIMKAEVKRYMDVPAPELVLFSNGYKIIRGVYRNFFALRNDGTLPYVGKITLRLYNDADAVVYEKTSDFSSEPIRAESAGVFFIDTSEHVPRFG